VSVAAVLAHLCIDGPEVIAEYRGKFRTELPPHVYALAEDAYHTLVFEEESQCIIISGESGAGKTEASKKIMNFIAEVSGGSGNSSVETVKRVILESNPLLEAFGNAQTIRNNNSSRFGKYLQIGFDTRGLPIGGKVTNYLLEKSRVVHQDVGERNYHIFFQILSAPENIRSALHLQSPQDHFYTKQGKCFDGKGGAGVEVDAEEFNETTAAMKAVNLKGKAIEQVLRLCAAVIHIGDLKLQDGKNDDASIINKDKLEIVASLLGVDSDELEHSLVTRIIETRGERFESTQNRAQATSARDALAKALYSKLFDWLVECVNAALLKAGSMDDYVGDEQLEIGVLDIFGFEIFPRNGYEQLLINFVNEKLQQVFVELTLRAEQEEYVREGIKWEKIKYFDNKIVCDLIEATAPRPGLLPILDDVCMTAHAMSDGLDEKFIAKAAENQSGHPHFVPISGSGGHGFIVKHYAGEVEYDARGFSVKNRDSLFPDIVDVLRSSKTKLVKLLFEEEKPAEESQPSPSPAGRKRKRPTSVGFKIRSQAADLLKALKRCNPHYIRCIKPNEKKKANLFETSLVKHQVKYLGLLENIRVRRAGFAYRADYDHFIKQFRYLSSQTFPHEWRGDDRSGCAAILSDVKGIISLEEGKDFQFGRTKLFVRKPETLFAMEEMVEDKKRRLRSHYSEGIPRLSCNETIHQAALIYDEIFYDLQAEEEGKRAKAFYGHAHEGKRCAQN